MRTKERDPLLSDDRLWYRNNQDELEQLEGHEVRRIYEAARAKYAELIQMAVDACSDPHKMSLARKFLDAAKAAGFTETEP